MSETHIHPISLCGSDVWGIRRQGNDMVDKALYGVPLGVKAITSNLMVLGESGQIPPNVFSHINVICYLKRLHHLPSRMIVTQMYVDLCRLHECGFVTWVTKAQEVMQYYGIQLDEQCPTVFKKYCKQTVNDKFVNYWTSEIQNSSKILLSGITKVITRSSARTSISIPFLIFLIVPPWRDLVPIHLKLSENDIRYQEPLFVTACVYIVTM